MIAVMMMSEPVLYVFTNPFGRRNTLIMFFGIGMLLCSLWLSNNTLLMVFTIPIITMVTGNGLVCVLAFESIPEAYFKTV